MRLHDISKNFHSHYSGKYQGFANSIYNLRYGTPKEIHAVFHNGSNYDNHFINKQVAEQFEDQFEYLGENTEKYVAFLAPREKQENGRIKIQNKIH